MGQDVVFLGASDDWTEDGCGRDFVYGGPGRDEIVIGNYCVLAGDRFSGEEGLDALIEGGESAGVVTICGPAGYVPRKTEDACSSLKR